MSKILGWPYRICPASGRDCYADECLSGQPCRYAAEIEQEVLSVGREFLDYNNSLAGRIKKDKGWKS